MLNRTNLETALNYADFNPKKPHLTKRRDAYVTEFFFETKVLPKIAYGSITLGWSYITVERHRWWFKSAHTFEYDQSIREIDKEFMTRIFRHDPEQRFFLVAFEGANISIKGFVFNNSKWVMRNLEHFNQIQFLSRGLVDLNKHLDLLLAKEDMEIQFCQTWLKEADDEYLITLLVQRELMNIALADLYPLDVDGIELSDEATIFHEFKRKDPCPNGYFVSTRGNNSIRELYSARKVIANQQFNNDSQLFDFINNELHFTRDQDRLGYGLDISHVLNVQYCDRKKISYKHTIWDSSMYPPKPNLDDLFETGTITPVSDLKILTADIAQNSFDGFIFTSGVNSGTIHQNSRMQFVVNKNEFQ